VWKKHSTPSYVQANVKSQSSFFAKAVSGQYLGVLNVLEKCANLMCSAVSGHRGDGMLLRVPRVGSGCRPSGAAKKKAAIEHFWLCSECAETMTFGFDRDHNKRVKVTVIPMFSARDAA
jgi:hypothetical protein